MTNALFWLVPISSVLALLFAWYFYKQLMNTDEGTPQMIKIALYVRRGAMSYLRQQYKVVGVVFLVLVILFSIMAFGFGYFPKKVFPGIRYSLVFDLRIGRLSRVFPYVRFCSPGNLSQLFGVLVASLLAVDGSFYLV